MSNNEIELFQKDKLTFMEKFYILMDLLITNQKASKVECIIFMGVSYLQIIVGFFAPQILVFKKDKSTSDKILYYCEKILRLSSLFFDKHSEFKLMIYFFFVFIVLFIIYFLIIITKTSKNSFYSYNELILNYSIKTFIYFGFNIILDFIFSNFCFGENEINPFFKGVSCKIRDNLDVIIISILLFILSVIVILFLQCFYCDSMYLSTSFYSRISCNYEIYSSINSIFFSLFLIQAHYLSKEIFLLYNIISSAIFFKFYIDHYLFYDKNTNILAGLYHILYLWTSIFSLIFAYIEFHEKGIIYLISSSIVLYLFFNLKYRIEENIFLDTPFHKIRNKSHFLYYLKNLIDKMNHIEENPEDRAVLAGIMEMHNIECPNPECLAKKNQKLYLPITEEWSDRSKLLIEDRVFLINYIIIVTNYFLDDNHYSPDMIINLSLYYLEIIGNYCQAMYYYKKVKEMKLSFQEQFSFERLKIKISKALIEKFKAPNEQCTSLEDLNVTIYFKYDDLSQQFIEEINNDVNLSLEFWKSLKNQYVDSNKQINYNKMFTLTDHIRLTKEKVENLWNKLLQIYNGVNDLFDLYSEYVEQINDDDLKKRDLDNLRRKNESFTDNLTQNYYSLLFNKDTGIIIANGDKGKEGIIEKINLETETIFKYKNEELKGNNVGILMPKNYASLHKKFIEKYFNVGEKIIIDKKDLRSLGKDKDNAIIMIKLIVKLFPMLNENVFFISLFSKENIDDIIFIDSKFIIQGMSLKLMKELNIDNNLLFQENDIPFYVICKKFVNFYKIFLKGKKQNVKEVKNANSLLDSSSVSNNPKNKNKNNNNNNLNTNILDGSIVNENLEEKEHENIEINENIELEYEIRLPQFLIDYAEITNKKNNFDRAKTINLGEIDNIEEEDDNVIESEFGESDLLVDDDRNSSISNISKQNKVNKLSNMTPNKKPINNKNLNLNNNLNKDTPTPNMTPIPELVTATPEYKVTINDNKETKNPNNPLDNSYATLSQSKIEFNKKNEREKEFIEKIKKYRNLFELGRFDELEDYIDNCNAESQSSDYKFNFTFDRYKYGNKYMSYIIRCIDNKNNCNKSEEESLGENDPKIIKYKKEKIEAIQPLYEIFGDEKNNILQQVNNFYSLSTENKNFQQTLNLCKEDINKLSMVHGTKKNEIQDDENSSQTSQSGFNSDLVKKNRIEEIRANLLNNVSNFYTLKYIKISVFCISVLTVIYGIIYLILFYAIFDTLTLSNQLNIELFQTTIWMTNLIGTLVSLRALFDNINLNQNYKFNSYIEDNYEYFMEMKKNNYLIYNNITKYFGSLEYNIGKYINNKEQNIYFWDKENITYYYNRLKDSEAFPLGLSQVLSDINSLLMNKYFKINKEDVLIDEHVRSYIQFISFSSIENSYDNIIPNQYLKIKIIPKLFEKSNSSSRIILFIILLIYACLIVTFCVIYSLLLHLTNENMAEGVIKVTKIKLERIEETIKKIENFGINLKKISEKDSQKSEHASVKSNVENTINQKTIMGSINMNNHSLINPLVISNEYNIESKRVIPLKILNFSYFQTFLLFCILCAFVIPIYLITNSMVTSTNKLIKVEKFMYGKILRASASILKVKCMMNECKITKNLEFNDIIDKTQNQFIVQGISLFDDLNIFYNDQFLLNACKAILPFNSSEYSICMDDILIQSANNTDSLLKLIDEIVDDLYNDQVIYKDNTFTLDNGTEVEFKNYYLFSAISFKNLETIFYKYIIPISNNFSQICIDSLYKLLKQKRNYVVVLTITFFFMVILLCVYIGFCFVNHLIHLLSVSRCILKIIPISVINNTQELESWIENKY